MKFHFGDRVQVINKDSFYYDSIGTVFNTSEHQYKSDLIIQRTYRVKFFDENLTKDEDDMSYFKPQELALVNNKII